MSESHQYQYSMCAKDLGHVCESARFGRLLNANTRIFEALKD